MLPSFLLLLLLFLLRLLRLLLMWWPQRRVLLVAAAAAQPGRWPDVDKLGRIPLQDLVAGPCMGMAETTTVSATLPRSGMEQPAVVFLVSRMGMGVQPPAAASANAAPPAAAPPSAVRTLVEKDEVCRSRAAMESKVAECLHAGKQTEALTLGLGGSSEKFSRGASKGLNGVTVPTCRQWRVGRRSVLPGRPAMPLPLRCTTKLGYDVKKWV